MKRLLRSMMSLALVCSLAAINTETAFAIGSNRNTCKICSNTFLYKSITPAAQTYLDYFGVTEIPNLTSSDQEMYYPEKVNVVSINGEVICFTCLTEKVNEHTQNIQKVDTATGAANIPITVTREAQTFSVTVPSSMPIAVAADGTVSKANNIAIVNESSLPVCVKSVTVSTANGWSLDSFDKTAMLNSTPGAKKLGLSLTLGSQTFTTTKNGTSEDIGSNLANNIVIAKGGQLAMAYDAVIPAQPAGVTETQAASVIFTIDWAE